MRKELPKVYEPQEVESRIYETWEKNGCFRGHRDPKKKPFTIVMPPPNVTGQLHMGHAMDSTLQDILIRFKRMQGLRRPVGPRHRPRGHRHPDQGGGGAAPRRA